MRKYRPNGEAAWGSKQLVYKSYIISLKGQCHTDSRVFWLINTVLILQFAMYTLFMYGKKHCNESQCARIFLFPKFLFTCIFKIILFQFCNQDISLLFSSTLLWKFDWQTKIMLYIFSWLNIICWYTWHCIIVTIITINSIA